MTSQNITRMRLAAQGISGAACVTPAEVVSRLGAVQAQDYLGSLWAIGLRMADATEKDVTRAIKERTIVRTWPMRGTLHFVAAADVRWMTALLAPRIIAGAAGRSRQLGLDEAVFAKSRKLLSKALADGGQLRRQELHEVMAKGGISPEGQRGIHILGRLSQEGLLCLGDHIGSQPSYVLLDEWLPQSRLLCGDEALAELALRYFTSHGPATLQDFVWWTGLKVTDARRALDMVKGSLISVEVTGRIYWLSPEHEEAGAKPGIHLLPGFDEYLLGYADRSAALAAEHAEAIVPGGNGMFMASMVVNGRITGTWKRTVKKKSVSVSPAAFAPLNKVQMRGLKLAAGRYSRFLGLPVDLLSDP